MAATTAVGPQCCPLRAWQAPLAFLLADPSAADAPVAAASSAEATQQPQWPPATATSSVALEAATSSLAMVVGGELCPPPAWASQRALTPSPSRLQPAARA